MRRMVGFAVLTLAMALPISAWADIITTNQGGTVAITGMSGTAGLGTIGTTTITSKGSQLTQWMGPGGTQTERLGLINYATGALLSGSVSGGGTFAGGGYFDIIGDGKWASKITGTPCGTGCNLFTGSFNGPITWTLDSAGKQASFYTLTGYLTGTLWNGRAVTNAQTSQNISILSKGQLNQGYGHITMGATGIATPEPGTLGLLGTGLLAVAGMFRRKHIGSGRRYEIDI
jgi:hypothetical protein